MVQWLRHLPRQQETLGSNPGESPTFFTCQKAQESWKIKHDISIQKISEEYQREDEGREEGKNGN